MSKRSREKHAKPEFVPTDGAAEDEGLCEECGFFAKQSGCEICEECAGAEFRAD